MGGQQSSQNEPPQNPSNPEVTWWCKLLARSIGTVGALIAIILGILTFIHILSPLSIVAGIVLILFAFLVIIMESPCCCMWFDFTKPIANFAESRAYWHKAIFYCVIAIIPIVISPIINTIFGGGMIFAAGVFYGLMALGRKADRDSMVMRAGGDTDRAGLMDNDESVP